AAYWREWGHKEENGALVTDAKRGGPVIAGPAGRSVEQARDARFRRRAADGLADERRDGDDADVRRHLHGLSRLDGIRDDELLEARGGDARHCPAREHAVRAVGVDLPRTLGEQGVGRVAQRAAGIDDVVDKDAGAPLDIA